MLTIRFFFIFITCSIFFVACKQSPNITTNNQFEVTKKEDSVSIVQMFNQALITPGLADSLIEESKILSQNNTSLDDVFSFNLSRYYIQSGKITMADSMIDGVLAKYDTVKKQHTLGKYYNLKAATAAYQHRQEASVYYYRQAIAIFEKHQDIRQLAVIQFNLANIFFSRLDYVSAYKYIKSSKENFELAKDDSYDPIVHGILAIAAVKTDRLDEGEHNAKISMKKSLHNKNILGEILANYASGELALEKGSFQEALLYFLQAEQLGEQYKIPNLNLPTKAALLNTYNHLKKYQEAVKTGTEAIAIAQTANNIEIQYSLHKNLAETYANINNEKLAYENLKIAERIFRNNTLSNNEEVLQKLLIEYETEKKNNLILKQENHLNRQRIYIVLLVAVAIIGLLVFLNYRKNVAHKRKIEQHNKTIEISNALIQGEEKERIRLANELHDGIASNLVAIKLQLENTTQYIDGHPIIQLVKQTHQEVRKVAHNLLPIDFSKKNWQVAIQDFCNELHSSKTAVHFYPSSQEPILNQKDALILYRSIQELLQNVIKHADAKNVTLQLLQTNKELRINIEDDGKGFDILQAQKDNKTLFKHEQRLKQIGAKFEIDSAIGEGTTIFICYNYK